MLMTIRKTHRKDAIDLFKLVQTAMGDRSARGRTFIDSATAIVDKTWSVNVLRDELYLQLCKQTTSNPSSKSEEAGWELIAICVTFFPPSTRFTSYLEGYICRHIKGDDKISQCVHMLSLLPSLALPLGFTSNQSSVFSACVCPHGSAS